MKTKHLQSQPSVSLGSKTALPPEQILMLKADVNYTEIFLVDGTKILSSTTLGTIEKRLEEYNFFRPNRSTVINLDYFKSFQKSLNTPIIELKKTYGKELVPIAVSRRRLHSFLALIAS